MEAMQPMEAVQPIESLAVVEPIEKLLRRSMRSPLPPSKKRVLEDPSTDERRMLTRSKTVLEWDQVLPCVPVRCPGLSNLDPCCARSASLAVWTRH